MDLTVTVREQFGRQVKALRERGVIPAELYGHGVANIHLAVPEKDFVRVFKEAGTNTVVTLMLGREKRAALIYDVTRDPLTGAPAHVDFYQVKMDEKIRAKVPLAFVGEAPAVKAKGAIVNRSMSEIEVEALPQDLPHSLTADLSVLDDVGKSIYVRDISIPKSVKVLVEENTAVATATPPAPVEEEKPEEAPVDVSAVKVETEEKKAERQAEKEEKGGKAEKAEKTEPAGGTAQAPKSAKQDTK
jgi:large subunit ribosomal protein L25